jgi:hypothetical protein
VLAARQHPPGTRLTSINHLSGKEGGHPGAVGAGADPGTPGPPFPLPQPGNGHEKQKQTPAQSVTRPGRPLDDRG